MKQIDGQPTWGKREGGRGSSSSGLVDQKTDTYTPGLAQGLP